MRIQQSRFRLCSRKFRSATTRRRTESFKGSCKRASTRKRSRAFRVRSRNYMASATTAKTLFEDGKVREAAKELTAYLRDRPADMAQRTFLFELLCFSGDFARAE